MAKESLQKKVGRVRPPRVHITYDVQVGDAIEKRDLPFVVGVLADLSGVPEKPLPAVAKRKFVAIDRDNVNDVDHNVIGSRQHAQYDSSRHSVPWNWGMFDTATASCAQPMKLWNVSSMYISTWLGNAENGGAFKMSQFGES